MDSSRTRNVSKRSDPFNFSAKTSISSRRTLSSSSFSSFSSCSSSSFKLSGESPLNSPATPLHRLGVPFSWEQLPGKPKDYSHRLNHRRDDENSDLLPLPPHRNTHSPVTGKPQKVKNSSKKNNFPVIVKDPFAAALLECSKDEGNSEDEEDDDREIVDRRFRGNSGGSKSSISDRFGLVNLYGSCRRSCAVTESIVYLPRPRKSASYDHLFLPRHRRR